MTIEIRCSEKYRGDSDVAREGKQAKRETKKQKTQEWRGKRALS